MNKNYLQNLICIITLMTLTAPVVSAQSKPSITKMQWLVGSWKGMANNQPFYEAWRKKSNTELQQYGITITRTDTTVSESGKITIQGEKAKYGDGQAEWTLASLTNEEMIFENPQLSFPKMIQWKKMPNGHWYCLLKANEQKVEYDIERLTALDKVVDRWIRNNKKS